MLKYSSFSGCARIHPVPRLATIYFVNPVKVSANTTQYFALCFCSEIIDYRLGRESMAHLSRLPFTFDIAWYSGLLNKFAS